jgi:hypothetical protein
MGLSLVLSSNMDSRLLSSICIVALVGVIIAHRLWLHYTCTWLLRMINNDRLPELSTWGQARLPILVMLMFVFPSF